MVAVPATPGGIGGDCPGGGAAVPGGAAGWGGDTPRGGTATVAAPATPGGAGALLGGGGESVELPGSTGASSGTQNRPWQFGHVA